ncbi:MAG: glycosyltransferase [Lachnospiraceae bacterium]|nr:glycosyltransferase [Lachnospiraceae bacterium]
MSEKKRRIIQLLPTLRPGDAIGNEVMALDKLLRANGHETFLCACEVLIPNPPAHCSVYPGMPVTTDDDIILYHLATGSADIHNSLPDRRGHLIYRYHNITPAHFFRGYSDVGEFNSIEGRRAIHTLKDLPELVICDSAFNAQDLRETGYTCPMEVCPIIMDFSDYANAAAGLTPASKGPDHIPTFLFVGRVAPNKCHHKLIAAVAAYKRKYNEPIRLRLAGSWGGLGNYHTELAVFASAVGLSETSGLGDGSQEVVMTGKLPFSGIVQEYLNADAFLCLSEHEGFCVPLLEAMYFDLPILAYDSTAVPETLGDGGLLLDSNDPYKVAEAMHRIVHDDAFREDLKRRAKARLTDFAQEKTEQRMLKILEGI